MNLYAFASLLASVFCFVLSLIVYLKSGQRQEQRSFAAVTFLIGIWTLFPYLASQAPNSSQALTRTRGVYWAALFVPSFFFQFMLHTMRIPHETWGRRILRGSYCIALFLLAFIASPLFIRDVLINMPYSAVRPGPLYGLFILYFGFMYFSASVRLLQLYRQSTGHFREHLKYIGLAFVIAFLAGVMHFAAAYRIPEVIPHDILVMSYSWIVAYAIVKYRIMDIRIAITRFAILVAVYACLMGLPFALFALYRGPLRQVTQAWPLLIPLLASGYALFASCCPFVYLALGQRAEARLLREQRQYQAALMNAARGMVQVRDLRRLLNLIVHLVIRAMKLSHAGIFLLDEKSGRYVLEMSRDRDILTTGLTLEADDPIVQWLRRESELLVSEEFLQVANDLVSPAGLADSLKRIEAAVVVPSFSEKTLIGFLVLGDKKTGQMYSQDDLNVLQTLANQAALAIQNAQFFQELQTKTAELIHESKLKSMGKMASGMSHQINNRMACLVAEASSAKEQYLTRLRTASSEAERDAIIRQLEAKLDSICEEGIKGSTIVKTLLNFSKPTTTFAIATLEEIIQGGLKMVGLKHELHALNLYVNVPKDHPSVKGNLSQLQDVFFNLIDNACDAIAWKANALKRSTLQVPESELPYQGQIAVIAKLSDDRTKHLITVADDGLGMTLEDRDRLFLPFHTTKGTAEKGTGLGLFVIREMLKGHRGDIRLEKSEYGKGTTFLVELPIPEDER